jgi:hypothetical protein
MAECGEVEREMAALVDRRRAQTSAAREALAQQYPDREERREYMRELARKSALARRQRRLEQLRADAERALERRARPE